MSEDTPDNGAKSKGVGSGKPVLPLVYTCYVLK
jgi:hypothetical protein